MVAGRRTHAAALHMLLLIVLVAGLSATAWGAAAGSSEVPNATESSWYRVSGSPLLYLPADKADWPPVVPPTPRTAAATGDPLTVETYNVATGEVLRQVSEASLAGAPPESESPPFAGLLPLGEMQPGAETVLPPDDRVRISPTTDYPWRTICKIYITFPDGGRFVGSGAIVDGFHVLTAGHVVHDSTHGGWATSLEIVPALDDTYMPYNHAWATLMRSYTGWTVDRMHEHDWGLITLDRSVGSYTGWMGRVTTTDLSWYTRGFNSAGYPGDLSSGLCLYFDFDYGRTATEYNHWYWIDTFGGQSGMPVWWLDGTNRYIATIHAYGDDGSGSNHGTRLNQNKFDTLSTWLASDTPPTDYADLLDDGQAYSGFSPSTVSPGEAFSAWCDIRNIGTGWPCWVYVSFYASTNTTISTSDYLIGEVCVPVPYPFDWGDADWSGPLPSIPPGTYYVGWIIDRYNNVPEYDEGNNTAYCTDGQLTVVAPPPVADFAADVTSGPAPLTVHFDNLTSGDVYASWCWDFGDGYGSACPEFEPTHTYTAPGVYSVGTWVCGPGGVDCEMKTDYITVYESVVTDFSASPTSGLAPLAVTFTDLTTGGPVAWCWEFGDGGMSYDQNPLHTYASVGTYTVTHGAANSWSCDQMTKTDYITVTASQTWFEDNDAALAYSGTWSNYNHPAATAGHAKISTQTNAQVSLTFTGTGVKWHSAKGPAMGKAYAYLDGSGPLVVDLYRSSLQLTTFSKLGLASGSHTVVIKVSGLKNSASAGVMVANDAFEVVP